MKLQAFEREAARVWEEIPDAYRSGVDGLVIERREQPHPTLPDIYTLGECLTESYPSDWGGPDTTRSVLVLYYGSFRRLARLDPEFDWEYEVWETITHELRHHLESLAAEDALEDVDYAMDENFKRFEGEAFDPYFFRSGEEVDPGVFAVEQDVFLEIGYRSDAPPGPELAFDWHGTRYVVPVPLEPGDVAFLQLAERPDEETGTLCLVLVRRLGALDRVKRWLSRTPPGVVDVDVSARPAAEPGEGDAG